MQQDTRKHLNSLRINKVLIIKVLVITLFFTFVFSSFITKDELPVSENITHTVTVNITEIAIHLDSIDAIFHSAMPDKKRCIGHYEASRKLYKEIEFYTEYHFPFHSKYFINSPLVNKAEFEYSYKTFVPHGFQVVEQILYSAEVDSALNIKYELALLKNSFNYIKDKSRNKLFKNSTVIDMLRFEIVRIMSLYLNGYDCTFNKQNLREIIHILKSFENTLEGFPGNAAGKASARQMIAHAIQYLSKNTDYDAFNRLYFITTYMKPLYQELFTFYDAGATQEVTNYAINIRRKLFYDKAWLNPNYFSVVLKDSSLFNKQAELGRLLFFDPVLSGNNQRACASCHEPTHAFGGSVDFNTSFGADEKLKRNTPPLLNAVFQKSFFTDGRSLQLEDQVNDVMANHKEMFSKPAEVIYKLRQSPGYRTLFHEAFKNTEDTTVTYYALLKAISEYERKLVSLNSRFDKYIRGDNTQLSKEEIKGYTVFAGKALCGSCHFFPLFNGLTPPFYGDNEFEVIGVPKNKLNKELDADSGRYHISKNTIHLASFKTPGIRNIELTAPYMHNGIYKTLEEVIDFYKKGGGAGLGLEVHNQTLPFDSLQLNTVEITNLKKFLLSLTDKTFKASVPKTLPVINIKGLEKRKVGGSY